jgi:hypothetical protein
LTLAYNSSHPENSVADTIFQKEKDEREWLITVLIILGIAIALGAMAIPTSSGGDGFFLEINN